MEVDKDGKISVGVLGSDGMIHYDSYNKTEVGLCLRKVEESVDYTTIIGVFIVIFAIILIAISIYCLCN